MILEATVILLVILILANVVVFFINKVKPPGNNVDEYLNSGKNLPDGQVSSLGSIQSGYNVNYVGVKLDGDSNNYVLKSKNTYYEQESRDEDMEMAKDSFTNVKYDEKTMDAVTKALGGSKIDVDGRKREVNTFETTNNTIMLDTEFEGISASNRTMGIPSNNANAMSLKSERDGYK